MPLGPEPLVIAEAFWYINTVKRGLAALSCAARAPSQACSTT